MAAPFVAGTCALLAENHPDWNLVQMMARLEVTAGAFSGAAYQFGAGVLDAGAALEPDRHSHIDDVPVAEVMRRH